MVCALVAVAREVQIGKEEMLCARLQRELSTLLGGEVDRVEKLNAQIIQGRGSGFGSAISCWPLGSEGLVGPRFSNHRRFRLRLLWLMSAVSAAVFPCLGKAVYHCPGPCSQPESEKEYATQACCCYC